MKINLEFKKFFADVRGIAAIEFSIWALVLVLPVLSGVDFSLYNLERMKLNRALGEGVIFAYNSRDNVDETTINNVLTASLRGNNQTIKIGCNGGTLNCTNTNRTCACLTGSNQNQPTFTANSCIAPCPSGSESGYYLNINAQTDYDPILNLGFRPPAKISQSITLRLE